MGELGLEVRNPTDGLTSDPENNVLIASLLERGLVRDIGVWTDEEAERCRLAAFHPVTPMSSAGVGAGVRHWWFELGPIVVTERFFSSFTANDFDLSVGIDPVTMKTFSKGKHAPRWCFSPEEGLYSKRRVVRRWSELVAESAARLEQRRAQDAAYADARAKRKALRRKPNTAAPPPP